MFTARQVTFLLVLAALALISIASSCLGGQLPIDAAKAVRVLWEPASTIDAAILLNLRLPRAISAFVTGGLLALAGTLMQVLLRNPLADPYILGVSGGASAGALGAMLLGTSSYYIAGGACLGSFASIVLVFWIANGIRGASPLRLLLTGVVTASGWGAVVSFMLTVAPEARLRGMMFWLMGDLSQSTSIGWTPVVLIAGTALAFVISASLNVLSRGDLQASAVGLPVRSIRLLIYVIASLFAACAVTIAGAVGFVGLVVPHIVRLLAGSDHRVVVPGSVLLGGTLLVSADLLARELMWPQQLPVGVVTALIGVPVFLLLLRRAQ